MPHQDTPDPDAVATAPSHLEQFTSYEDGDCRVVCDRKAPRAWIRSDETVPITR